MATKLTEIVCYIVYECVMQQTVAHLCYKEIIKDRKNFY